MRFSARLRFGLAALMLALAWPTAGAWAQPGTEADDAALQPIMEAFEQRFEGVEVTQVRATPMPHLYEVQIGMDIVYVDENVDYVIQGSLVDARTREDLTSRRLQKLAEVPFDTLPLELAVKQVRGQGSRELAIFEDPNCPYCKRLHQTLKDFDDITIYSFLYPVLSQDSVTKARDVWCAEQPAQVWHDWMLKDKTPPTAECDTAPIEEVVNLGRSLRVQGTPAILFSDGRRVDGAVPAEQIQARLDALDE